MSLHAGRESACSALGLQTQVDCEGRWPWSRCTAQQSCPSPKLQSLHSRIGLVSEQYRRGIDCEVDVGEDSPGLLVESTVVAETPLDSLWRALSEVATAMLETFDAASSATGIPAISSHGDSASALHLFFPAPLLIASLPQLSPSPAWWSSLRWSLLMLSVRAFSRSNPVALPSNCDPGLVAALLELLHGGLEFVPRIWSLSALARSGVGIPPALPLMLSSDSDLEVVGGATPLVLKLSSSRHLNCESQAYPSTAPFRTNATKGAAQAV